MDDFIYALSILILFVKNGYFNKNIWVFLIAYFIQDQENK